MIKSAEKLKFLGKTSTYIEIYLMFYTGLRNFIISIIHQLESW
jgi:exonuclease V gamma subunit